MLLRIVTAWIGITLTALPLAAQIHTTFRQLDSSSRWGGNSGGSASDTAAPATTPAATAPSDEDPAPASPAALTPIGSNAEAPARGAALSSKVTRVTKGSGVLPNEHGQVWREYDIAPYTSRVTTTAKPEQAIIDWILRETGTELWFGEPLGILSASAGVLRVYHTPEIQAVVSEIVDRFVSSEAESHAFSVHLVTVGSPNWRAKGFGIMQAVPVQTPGLEAWLLTKENAALLLAELRKRTDFQEHSSPNLMIHNGQSHTIASMRPTNFVKAVHPRPEVFPGYEVEMGQVDEGYSLQLSPLLSLHGDTVDAVIKAQVDQVERLVPIKINVPAFAAQPQRVEVQVPQMSSWSLHERFRWPSDQVLLLSRGVVAAPSEEKPNVLGIPVSNPFDNGPGRADALLFVSSNGKAAQNLNTTRTAAGGDVNYRGRY